MEVIIGNKYKLCKRLGKGAFGELFQGVNTKTNEEVAIKLEKLTCPNPMLQYEAKLYERLQGLNGIPKIHWFGSEGDYYVMILDIHGPSLMQLFEFCDYKFSMKTITWIASQMV